MSQHTASISKTNQPMTFKDITAHYSQNRIKSINKLCRHTVNMFTVKGKGHPRTAMKAQRGAEV
jgi:hypothetical protein